MNAETLRRRDTDHLTIIIGKLQVGQEFKTECYAARGWAVVERTLNGIRVKLPKSRLWIEMSDQDAVSTLVRAHHG